MSACATRCGCGTSDKTASAEVSYFSPILIFLICYDSMTALLAEIESIPSLSDPLRSFERLPMSKQYLGHLSSQDPVHPYLVEDVLPQIGVRERAAEFRVFSMKDGK